MECETKYSASSWGLGLFSKAYEARITTIKTGEFTEFKVDVNSFLNFEIYFFKRNVRICDT